MILDIGCGNNKHGDIGIDIIRNNQVNVVADAHFLPFKNEAFDTVYCSHIIEHFSHTESKMVLSEWLRVLVEDGKIEIRCPDLRMRALFLFFNFSERNVCAVYGRQDQLGNYHKNGFSHKTLKALLQSCGVERVKRVMGGYNGLPFIPCDLYVKGIKAKKL